MAGCRFFPSFALSWVGACGRGIRAYNVGVLPRGYAGPVEAVPPPHGGSVNS
jgi:hypothetical protein